MKYLINKLLFALAKLPGVNKLLAKICGKYLAIYENPNYEHQSNGERWLLQILAKQNRISQCFDAGANRGDWTALVLEENPDAEVHCFEISPPTFSELIERLSGNSKLVINPFGLSDQSGSVVLNHCLDSDKLSSLFDVICSSNIEMIDAKVVRGIDYCIQHHIEKIDFLKIDVEGAENLVLEGFSDFLTPENIPVIQFEYGQVNIVTKFLLRDFYEFFENRGYVVGKLFPQHIRFREYTFEDEDFRGPNYVAVSPEVAELLGK